MRQTISVLDAQCPWQDTPTVFPLSLPEYAGLRLPIQQVHVRVLAFFVVHFSSETGMRISLRKQLFMGFGGAPIIDDAPSRQRDEIARASSSHHGIAEGGIAVGGPVALRPAHQ